MDSLITNILLIGVVLFGGILVFLLKEKVTGSLKYILAYSGAFMLAVAVIHLIPEVYGSGNYRMGIYVLLGFLIQLILEYFSQGIEHGHIHVHENKSVYFLAPVLISLCIHALLEGVPLAKDFAQNAHFHGHGHEHGNSFLVSILMHKFPIAIALMTLFVKSKVKLSIAFMWLVIFALMAPLGNFIGTNFESFFSNNHVIIDNIMGIVLGMFLHISTTILFESEESHKFNLLKLIIIILGGTTAILVL